MSANRTSADAVVVNLAPNPKIPKAKNVTNAAPDDVHGIVQQVDVFVEHSLKHARVLLLSQAKLH